MNNALYFDYAAATPMDKQVAAVMQPFFTTSFYNPSATYAPAQKVASELQQARSQVAAWFGSRPSEVIFTAGGTEANNLAIHGVMQKYPKGNVIVSSIEHEAVLNAAKQYNCHELPVDVQGMVNSDDVRTMIDDHTVLVSIMYANNEVGTIEPIRNIAHVIQEVREQRRKAGSATPLYLHTDACQAAAYLDLHVARLGVDLMTINGGKIYGPKQSGALFVKAAIELEPLIYGGGQERGLRSGTENVAACIGLSKALDIVQNRRHAETERLQKLQTIFFQLLESRLPNAVINGSRKKRLPNNVHVTFPGQDNERLLLELEMQGILAAAGSACSASNEEPSHVLRALGLSDSEAQASVRFSMGHSTDEAAITKVVDVLVQLTA